MRVAAESAAVRRSLPSLPWVHATGAILPSRTFTGKTIRRVFWMGKMRAEVFRCRL